tara:strand:+ start:203 stop:670 length:468 start_codon:yes stop_codon:yes gene_type:complete
MGTGFGPILPLVRSDEDGHYALHKAAAAEIKEDFKTLLMTNPGERVMDSRFGVGIRRYLFEQNVQQTWSDIDARIRSQAKAYLPAIRINSIDFAAADNTEGAHENYLGIKIDFTIIPLKIRNTFNISRSESGGVSLIESLSMDPFTSKGPPGAGG